MGSDESHFNVSLIVRDKVTRQCPQTTPFEEKEEPKWIRTEVSLLTSLAVRPNRPTYFARHFSFILKHSLKQCTGVEIVQRSEPVLLLFCLLFLCVSLVEKNDALKINKSLYDDDDDDDDDDDEEEEEEEEEEDQCK